MPIYQLDGPAPRIHPTAFIHPDAVLIGNVAIGAQSSVWPGAVLRADFGKICIGSRTSVQDGTVIHTTRQWPTIIGDECVVGHNTHLEGCTIEDRCLIGSGSVVLNRAFVGRGSIVGAQALVAEDFQVPAGSMVLGVPAKVRGPIDNTAWIEHSVNEYVAAAEHYLRHLTPVSLTECRTDER